MPLPPKPRFSPISEETAHFIYQQGEEHVVRLLVNLSERLALLEARMAKDSHNSSKPPSSDDPHHPLRPNPRQPSGKKPGGQNGHPGSTLQMSATPDKVVRHGVCRCDHCQRSLKGMLASLLRRQVYDLPLIKMLITEHQVESIECPFCGMITTADFPDNVPPGATYGERFQSFATYLQHQHLVPYDRTADLLADLTGHRPSPGTLANFQQRIATQLSAVEQFIIDKLCDAPLVHVDETGVHCVKTLYWLHNVSTEALTLYGIDAKRGGEAMDRIGILPRFAGKVVHDHWQSYFDYDCEHVLCNAHHLRELLYIEEAFGERWAAQMRQLLLTMKHAVDLAISSGATAFSMRRLRQFRTRYDDIIAAGERYHQQLGPPGPPGIALAKKRGRKKQRPGKNLLDRLKLRVRETLAFLYDFTVPFTNNLAERDLRMAKVKEKISGCFRSVAAARAFFRIRGYISTARKQGWNILGAIAAAVRGEPLFPEIADVRG